MGSFDGKFLKLYFAWISLAPSYTFLTQNMKWHNKISLYGYISFFWKNLNCYGLILLNLKKNQKSIKIDKAMPGNMG